MKVIRSKEFVGDRAWAAIAVANMRGITTRVHWTDQPYHWHVNTGEEVFAVLDGEVHMHYVDAEGVERCELLGAGDIFFAGIGTRHFASPKGAARILVLEQEGSE